MLQQNKNLLFINEISSREDVINIQPDVERTIAKRRKFLSNFD